MRYNITMPEPIHDYYTNLAADLGMSFSEFTQFSMGIVDSFCAVNPDWKEYAGNAQKLQQQFMVYLIGDLVEQMQDPDFIYK